ncbi:MAG: alkaline phosphatase [Bacilli bacterium]|jgi:alkaline phosphatase|nr:alkaline phosphatase [Bacilli bacterium]
MKNTLNLFAVKVRAYLFYIFIFIACLTFSNPLETFSSFSNLGSISGYKNVILMIGDGMGYNHIQVSEAYNESPLFMTEEAEVFAWAKTRSFDKDITDSAASATALSTGEKVKNKHLAIHEGEHFVTMSEFAKAYEKGVGIIATETLTGATPAGFTVHNVSRDNTDEIAMEQFENEVDFYIGAGKDYYDGKKKEMAMNNLGYYTDFNKLKADIDLSFYSEKTIFTRLFASFSSISTTTSSSSKPSLEDLSIEAINYLNRKYNDKGFFMMIEGSHIDKRAHDNDIFGMIDQLNGFDNAVSAVVDWARSNGETFVLVTADHETGGLMYHGESKEQLNNSMFTTSDHTGVNVPVFAYNLKELNLLEDDMIIDNTDIAKLFHAMIR